jgi:protocatechuate 4,5-dioxygenase beta chain
MSQIVAAVMMSHDPLIPAMPEAAPAGQRAAVAAAHAAIQARLTAARPDYLVVVAPEHLMTFAPGLVPPFTVGGADVYEGPVEQWLGIPRFRWAGDPAWAQAVVAGLLARGFDVTWARELTLDHGVVQPLHYVWPEGAAPRVVPVVVNCVQPPLVSLGRAWALGEALRAVVEALPGEARVALLGSGGLSHWVGTPETGRVNAAWDRQVLAWIAAGEGRRIAELSPAEVAEAGNGAEEIRAWLVVLGAMGGRAGRVLAYEPVPEWITGLGYVEIPVEVG